MLKVRLENIKAVKDHTYEFKQNGIYSFIGSNGNGKSALTDALTAVTTMSFYDMVGRKSLISWWSEWARITITTEKTEMSIYLTGARAECRMTYTLNGDTQTVSFNDKGALEKIISLCGFGGFGDKRVSIQVHSAFGDVPFITTGPKVDAELIESITKDEFAIKCQENFQTITAPKFRRVFENYNNVIEGYERDIRLLSSVNIAEEQEKLDKVNRLLDICDLLEPVFKQIKIKKLEVMPTFKFANINLEKKTYIQIPTFKKQKQTILTLFEIPKLKVMKYKPLKMVEIPKFRKLYVPNITKQDFIDGKCPICGSKVIV